MSGEQAENKTEQQAPAVGGMKRQMSTIEFPYGDLDDAIEFARAVREVGGQECGIEQVAGFLKQSPASGAFRLRLSYPRIFGLTTNERGTVRLTELGMRIIDSAQEKSARADAFLGVPLYRAIYEKYKGYQLPPPAALEREMVTLGVSSKQKDKARQAFDRSAKQAGFFWAGADRLVMPALKAEDAPATRPIQAGMPGADSKAIERQQLGGGGGDGFHPFIVGLLRTLPEPGSEWAMIDRVKWLRAAASVFTLIYQGDEGSISVGEG